MKRFFLSLSLISALFAAMLMNNVYATSSSLRLAVLPGSFSMAIFGDLTEGINLQGIGPATSNPQTGYWNATQGEDYLLFADSSDVDGFRIKMFLDGDFVYNGSDPDQDDLPPGSFTVYGKYNSTTGLGEIPTKGVDDPTKTLIINGPYSCVLAVPSNYSFNTAFKVPDFKISLSSPFDYFTSNVTCANQGFINLGRFELNLGVASAGTYSASLYMLMVDG